MDADTPEPHGHDPAPRATVLHPWLDDAALPDVYDELQRLASSKLRTERDDHTLDTSALAHEAYIKMSADRQAEWSSRSHFLALAAIAMRRILVDYAKRRTADKRGGGDVRHVTLDASSVPDGERTFGPVELLQLESSLTALADFNPRGAAVVQYRFFAGLTQEEISEVMGLSVPTVARSWAVARAWLASRMDA